jgi:hypothetical protein
MKLGPWAVASKVRGYRTGCKRLRYAGSRASEGRVLRRRFVHRNYRRAAHLPSRARIHSNISWEFGFSLSLVYWNEAMPGVAAWSEPYRGKEALPANCLKTREPENFFRLCGNHAAD